MAINDRVDVRGRLVQTRQAVGGAARRWDTIGIFAATTLAYLLIYLWAIQEFSLSSGSSFSVMVVNDPLARMFEPGIGRFLFEPIAIIDLGFATYLFSPINSGIGLVIAGLVGANFALMYLSYVQPAACGVGTSSGMLAAVPAILSGGTCCAPLLFLVLGITATGTMLSIITWLLPVGLVVLVASVIYLAGQINTTAVAPE